MIIARFSALSSTLVLTEARGFFCAERSSPRAVCRMEGNLVVAHQVTLPVCHDPSSHVSVPAPEHLCPNPSSSSLAFVYGTLKRGFGNYWLMEELLAGAHAHFLGLACTRRRFPLVCGPFQVPFLLPSPSPSGHNVHGELYEVDAFAISRLDDLEGVTHGHYERRAIDIFLLSGIADADAFVHEKNSEMGMDMNQRHAHAHPSDTHAHQVNGVTDPSYLDLDTSSCYLAGPLTSCRPHMDPPHLDETDALSSSTVEPQSSGSPEYLRAEAYFACPSYGLQMAECAPHIPCYTEKEASAYVPRKDRPDGRTFLENIHAWMKENGFIYT